MKKLLLLAIVVLGISAVSFGQNGKVTTTSNASGTIITTLEVKNDAPLEFGNIAVNDQLGTVILHTDGSRDRTGGVALPSTKGTVNAAKFTVKGEAGYAFTLAVTSGDATVENAAGDKMTIDTWDVLQNETIVGGTQSVFVGATLHVGASQAPGTYTTITPFTVTVNYN